VATDILLSPFIKTKIGFLLNYYHNRKKNLNRFISQPEKGAGYSVSDMLINMLSWNASVTHDTQLQRRDLDWQRLPKM